MAADSQRLEKLIILGEIQKVLSEFTLEEVADAWCRYQARPHLAGFEDDDPDWWGVFLLTDPDFWTDELRVRTVIDLLVERATGDEVLGAIGAGPLEDFISDDEHGLVWIEQRAAASDRFREALRHVWIWRLSPEAFERIELAAGQELARPANEVEIVPGDLSGTVHVKVNGETALEFETDHDRVDDLIDILSPDERSPGHG